MRPNRHIRACKSEGSVSPVEAIVRYAHTITDAVSPKGEYNGINWALLEVKASDMPRPKSVQTVIHDTYCEKFK